MHKYFAALIETFNYFKFGIIVASSAYLYQIGMLVKGHSPNPPELTSGGQAAHLKCRRSMKALQSEYQLSQNLQD